MAAAEILTVEREGFRHHRELLLRAFGGWIIGPSDETLRKRAIRIGIALRLADCQGSTFARDTFRRDTGRRDGSPL